MKIFIPLIFIIPTLCFGQNIFYGVACPPPSITVQPVAQTAGTNVTISIPITVANAITYQWKTNNGSGTYINVSNTVGHFGGTGTSTLWYTNTLTTDSNYVNCVIANGCGSVTSSAVLITITNGAAVICATNIVQDLNNEQYNTSTDGAGTVLSQSFTAVGNINVCKFRAFLTSDAGGPENCTIQLRTASNGGGSLLGTSISVSVLASGSGAQYYDFTFSSPVAVSNGAVVYGTLVPADGVHMVTWNRYNTSQVYAGGFAFHNATQGFYDFTFQVWTQ